MDVGIVFQIVGVVGVSALVNGHCDRPGLERDFDPGGEVLRNVPAGPGAFQAIRVRVVEQEEDSLRAGEGADRFARAGQDLLDVGRAVAGARQVMQPPQGFDAARDPLAHAVEGDRETPDLVP